MNIEDFTQINDVEKLKEETLLLIKDFTRKEHNYQFEIRILNEQIKSLQDKLFGRRTEKIARDDGQLSLFDIPEPEYPILEKSEETTVAAYTRQKAGRKTLPEDLPRVEVIHELTDEERQCPCGCLKTRCGQEVSEQLDYIPSKVQVIRNMYRILSFIYFRSLYGINPF